MFVWGAKDFIVVKPDTAQAVPPKNIEANKSAEADKKAVKELPQERLLPFIDAVVLEVDLKAKTMLVDWDADF